MDDEKTATSIDDFARRGGEGFYRLFNQARVVLMFVLGCGLIIYSVIDSETNLAYIIVGTVLIGLVPADQWVQATIRRKANGDDSKVVNVHVTNGGNGGNGEGMLSPTPENPHESEA